MQEFTSYFIVKRDTFDHANSTNSVVEAYWRPGPIPIGVLHHVSSMAGVKPQAFTTS